MCMALFESTASAPDSAQASLARPVVLTKCACFEYYVVRAEPENEPKVEALDSKRAYASLSLTVSVT